MGCDQNWKAEKMNEEQTKNARILKQENLIRRNA